MKTFDIYDLCTPEEREVLNETIAEAITRELQIDGNSFDYELTGVLL